MHHRRVAPLGELWRGSDIARRSAGVKLCHLLTDPQTSGGLLVACAADAAEDIAARIVAAGYRSARVIGAASEGPPSIVAR